jgi:hypothetical protein
MFHFAMTIITMFILSTAVFVAYDNKAFGVYDRMDLAAALISAMFMSLLWPITIPAFFIIGCAWLAANLISSYYKGER